MKRALVILAVVLGAPIATAFAQTTVSYNATVTAATNGVDAASFPVGSSLVFSYTLNPAVADGNGDPSQGVFPNAVLALSVSFPGLGISAVAGASGPAQTFDNVDSGGGVVSDQVFFIGGPISAASMLGGSPIDSVEVDFLSAFLTPPDEPLLLTSDALPLSQLNGFENFVILHTANGNTYVHFTPIAGPVVRVTANGVDDLVNITQGSPLEVRVGFDAGASGAVNPAQLYIGVITPFAPYVFWLNGSGNWAPAATPPVLFTGSLTSFPLTPVFTLPNTANLPTGSYYWFMLVDNDNNGVVNGTFHDFAQVNVSPPASSSRQ